MGNQYFSKRAENIALYAIENLITFEEFKLIGGNDKLSKSDIICLSNPNYHMSVKAGASVVECRMTEEMLPTSTTELKKLAYERLFVSNRKQSTYHKPSFLVMVNKESAVVVYRVAELHPDMLKIKVQKRIRKGKDTYDLVFTGLNALAPDPYLACTPIGGGMSLLSREGVVFGGCPSAKE